MIRFYLKIQEKFERLIFPDGSRVGLIPFVFMVKFKLFAQFSVDQLPLLILLLLFYASWVFHTSSKWCSPSKSHKTYRTFLSILTILVVVWMVSILSLISISSILFFQILGDCSKGSNYDWHHRHLYVLNRGIILWVIKEKLSSVE